MGYLPGLRKEVVQLLRWNERTSRGLVPWVPGREAHHTGIEKRESHRAEYHNRYSALLFL